MKLNFKFPPEKKILIYDNSNSQIFKKYIKNYGYNIFFVRLEEINIHILFLSFIYFLKNLLKFNFKSIKNLYIEEFIKISNPKVIISFIDNRVSFFLLKKKFPKIKFFLFQNGNSLVDFQKKLLPKKDMYIDNFFVFNQIFKLEYEKRIRGKKIIFGSIKNNSVKILKKKNIDLLFISQFRNKTFFNKKKYLKLSNGHFLSWQEFYRADSILIKYLGSYCTKNNIKLSIAGFYKKNQNNQETRFFKKNLINFKKLKWKIYSRENMFASYKLLDKAKLVVFLDSALGYEALMRNTKVVSVCIRRAVNRKFGWPKKLKSQGPFWTNSFDEIKINQILDNIININQIRWNKMKKKYINDLIFFNKNNSLLKQELKKILQ